MKNLIELAKEFFTGVRTEKSVIDNPFTEDGLLVLECKYFGPSGEQFGTGYGLPSQKQIDRLYVRTV